MPASLSPHHGPVILPSLPPSPSLLEEVFSHPRPWSVHFEDSDPQSSRRSSPESVGSHSKGKEKQTLEDGDEGDEDAQHRVGSREAYPPMTDEVAETRRVEETLKRWELAERQRRKTARESVQYTSGPSLFSSVTRTASLMLSRRSGSISASAGPGSTRTFKSHESVDIAREGYAVPLGDLDSSSSVAIYSPGLSALDHRTSSDARTRSSTGMSENPFVHPSEHTPTRLRTPVTPTRTLSPSTPPSPTPFSDARGRHADLPTDARKRSSGSREPFVPPPRPLGLPPPPSDTTPRATPLQPTSHPVLQPSPQREDSEAKEEVRWWHDWLCGCGEGPDRGGDNQAGRTNPFE